LGRVDKGEKCSMSGCSKDAERSIPTDKAKSAGLTVGGSEKRAYLCKEHYKEYKKLSKKDKTLEKWRYGA
jgi:thymidine kinase